MPIMFCSVFWQTWSVWTQRKLRQCIGWSWTCFPYASASAWFIQGYQHGHAGILWSCLHFMLLHITGEMIVQITYVCY